MNEYYDHGTYPAPNTKITSAGMRAELDSVELGFDKLPVLLGNGGKKVKVKADETGLEAVADTQTALATSFSATVGIAATNVQAAIEELDAEKAASGHSHTASGVSFTPAGTIAASNVQAAITELDSETQTALSGKSSTSHSHGASAVSFTPVGTLAATDVQGAIAELESEKSPTGHTHTGTYQPASANLDEYAAVNPTAAGLALLDDADAAAQRATLGLGSAATLTAGTAANNLVQLDGTGKLPAVDGSQLTGLSAALPTQTGNSGKFLTTNGTSASWGALTSGGVVGQQVFTASGTFTIPTGITTVKMTVVGGGNSGQGGGVGGSWGGGSGGCAIKVLTGLTPGNTLSVTVGNNTGGTSSVSSGTQTISTVSATGGSSTTGVAGIGSGGDLNLAGGSASHEMGNVGGTGGSSIFGGGGVSGSAGRSYGAGGGGGSWDGSSGGAGGAGSAGVVVFEW